MHSYCLVMHLENESFRMIAKTFAGLEEVLADEISGIGGTAVRTLQRAVEFYGTQEVMYKVNYLCRSALRVLKPIAEFDAPDENALYKEVRNIPWENYMDIESTFSIDGTTSYSKINHSKYLALKSKDAIVDKFREETGKRPSVDTEDADLRINVRVFKDRCTVSLDSSGESLHKRGYRLATGPAPLNEVLAAGMILLTGWKGDSNFIDPMCGSGTLPIEAAMLAKNIPAGQHRESYSFQQWKDYDKACWETIKQEAAEKIKPLEYKVVASDRSGRILQVAKSNIEQAGLQGAIEVHVDFIDDVTPPEGGGILVTNPPYGERIKPDDINLLYKSMGDNLKNQFEGYSAWVISSHLDALKFVGLKPSKKISLNNGQLKCKYMKFEIYAGSRKLKPTIEQHTKGDTEPHDESRVRVKKLRKRIPR